MTSAAVDFCSTFLSLVIASTVVGSTIAISADWIFDLRGIFAAGMLVAVFAVVGLYVFPGHGPCERLRLRFLGALVFSASLTVIATSMNGVFQSIALGVASLCCLVLFGYFAQEALRIGFGGSAGGPASAAIVGTSDVERKIAKSLLEHPEIGIKPSGFLALPDQPTVGVELPLPLLGRLDGSIAETPQVEFGILAMAGCDRDQIEARLGHLPFRHIATIKDLQALHAYRLRPGAMLIDRQAAFGERDPQLVEGWQRIVKRCMDVVLTLPIAILTLPLLLAAIICVRILDPGNAIYVQRRIGLGGREFGVFKIRTMYRDAEARLERVLADDPVAAEQWKTHFKLEKDPRIIPGIGNILRRFSIDELPQLWNVIRGDMSLVGPRPFPAYHLRCFDAEFQTLRQSVIPGLTGLWQISSRSDGDLVQQKEQDLLYIKNWSLWLDFQILLQTVPAVLRAKGAR